VSEIPAFLTRRIQLQSTGRIKKGVDIEVLCILLRVHRDQTKLQRIERTSSLVYYGSRPQKWTIQYDQRKGKDCSREQLPAVTEIRSRLLFAALKPFFPAHRGYEELTRLDRSIDRSILSLSSDSFIYLFVEECLTNRSLSWFCLRIADDPRQELSPRISMTIVGDY
jgi:hypothetical protein